MGASEDDEKELLAEPANGNIPAVREKKLLTTKTTRTVTPSTQTTSE